MKKNGFTFFELVIVVIVLGVLAVAAIPRFFNLQTSARTAVIDGISDAMKGVIVQVQSKAIIEGLVPSAQNPGGSNQTDYVIDLGIGSVEVDWATLCPESIGEAGDALTMFDFLTLSTNEGLTSAIGNRHTVIGFEYSFSASELGSSNITTLPSGCYVIYDSFGGRSGGTCPAGGCECTVRVMNDDC